MAKLNIPIKSFPTSVDDAYNNLMGIKNQQVNIHLDLLDEIDNQPFPINESKVQQIAESIENVGVIEAIIVVRNGDRYSILSGRHRYRACKMLGKREIPCIVKEYSADEPTARYILLATNTDRNNEYSPTVYARAYAEQLELMKQMGKKSTVSEIAENNNMSRKQIYRYIRLNSLIPELQKWVDNGIISIEAVVELSYISEIKQHILYGHIENLGIAENVVSRHFKVATTKKIHTTADTVTDDEFEKNIDKIIFGNYKEKTSVSDTQVGLDEVPLPPVKSEIETETTTEQKIPIAEETTAPDTQVVLKVPSPIVQSEIKTEFITEQEIPITEETSVPDTQVGLKVPSPTVQNEIKTEIVTEQETPTEKKTQTELPIRFRNMTHETNYHFIRTLMKRSDIERKVLAYLFSLDVVCCIHIREIYNFDENTIIPNALDKEWQTSTSRKTTRLAFNLFNGCCSDGETYIGSDTFEELLPSAYFTPVNLFCCEYAPYYIEALKMRFPEYFKEDEK